MDNTAAALKVFMIISFFYFCLSVTNYIKIGYLYNKLIDHNYYKWFYKSFKK